VAENQQNLNQLNNLSNLKAQAMNTPPDLNALATDTSGLGDTKLTESLVAQTLPDVPSTTPLLPTAPAIRFFSLPRAAAVQELFRTHSPMTIGTASRGKPAIREDGLS
jgi:hypothetical protein